MASDGILFTSTDGAITPVETEGIPAEGTPTATDPSDYDVPVHIVTYIDFGCPFCKAFEDGNSEQIQALVEQGYATLEAHPINLLSRSFQGDRYSARSANAGACVAAYEPEKFLDVSAAFYAQQPAETGPGLTNDEIVTLLQGAGVDSQDVVDCVKNESFKDWVTASTTRALAGPLPNTDEPKLSGTPLVLVNGVKYTPAANKLGDPQEFAAFVTANADFSSTDDGASPTPTPTP
jgi:protein-disulfide isomerase